MKKLMKIFFVLILGIVFVSCSETGKNSYKLEGTYITERENFFNDGVLARKGRSEIKIIKNGKNYTITGNEFFQKKYRDINYATKEVREEYWEDIKNISFTFTGKIVEFKEQKPVDSLPHKTDYIYILENDKGNRIVIFIYKDVYFKEVLKTPAFGYNDVINVNSDTLDMIKIFPKNGNFNFNYIEGFKQQ